MGVPVKAKSGISGSDAMLQGDRADACDVGVVCELYAIAIEKRGTG